MYGFVVMLTCKHTEAKKTPPLRAEPRFGCESAECSRFCTVRLLIFALLSSQSGAHLCTNPYRISSDPRSYAAQGWKECGIWVGFLVMLTCRHTHKDARNSASGN